MSVTRLLQLYPVPGGERELTGLYLDHRLHALSAENKPLVYGNFVSSLDGRIALTDEHGCSETPECLTTPSDWRLFQELHAQADCVITHAAYLREFAEGRLGNVLQVGLQPEAKHLVSWRKREGLAPQPDIVVASASLDFPMPACLNEHGQTVRIATGVAADLVRIEQWRNRGFEVLIAGEEQGVQGEALIHALRPYSYRSIYLLAGPRMLSTTLSDGVLDRLYLTMNHRLLGGERFHTLLTGAQPGPRGRLDLMSLYFQPGDAHSTGQFFACFQPKDPA